MRLLLGLLTPRFAARLAAARTAVFLDRSPRLMMVARLPLALNRLAELIGYSLVLG